MDELRKAKRYVSDEFVAGSLPAKVARPPATPAHNAMIGSRSLQSRQIVRSSQNTASSSQENASSVGASIKENPFSNCDAMLSGVKPSMPTTAVAPMIVIEDPPITIESPPQDLPPELRNLHPVIQEELTSSPKLIKLLKKHPEVITNFHADAVHRLADLLEGAQTSKDLQQILGGDDVRSISDAEAAACRTVTVSGLPNNATANDVEALFGQFGPVEVDLPHDSKKKKHVGVAYVKLVDARIAAEAVRVINGSEFFAATDFQRASTTIVASPAVVRCAKKAFAECVHWKACDELWQQRMFNPHASVCDEGIHTLN